MRVMGLSGYAVGRLSDFADVVLSLFFFLFLFSQVLLEIFLGFFLEFFLGFFLDFFQVALLKMFFETFCLTLLTGAAAFFT